MVPDGKKTSGINQNMRKTTTTTNETKQKQNNIGSPNCEQIIGKQARYLKGRAET